MRIALLTEQLNKGGLPNYVLALARLLIDADCAVLVAHGDTPLPGHLEVAGLSTLHLPGLAEGAGDEALNHAAAALVAWSPDIMHVRLCSSIKYD